MVSLGRIFGKGAQVVKTLGANSSVKTADVRCGKVSLGGFDIKGLLSSPKADEFIRRGKGEIIGDNIIRYDGSIPYRVLTKRLPDGSVVSMSYDVTGNFAAKEILKRNGFRSYYANNATVILDPKGENIVSQQRYVERMHAVPDVSKTLAAKAVGLTERANENNATYKTLKDSGLIAS